jgi:peroxiredoxin Q/BCP
MNGLRARESVPFLDFQTAVCYFGCTFPRGNGFTCTFHQHTTMPLSSGDRAPDFTLPSTDGTMISLKDLRGKKVVLFFYPKDDTPGCTNEACSFRDNLSRMKRKGAALFGVSPDSVASHQKFTAKYKLNFPLLSDESTEVLKAYGVWQQKSFMGRKYMGVVRTTFVIDERGKIAHIFPNVKVEGHTDEVLAVL